MVDEQQMPNLIQQSNLADSSSSLVSPVPSIVSIQAR
jgi:hypothetical protein